VRSSQSRWHDAGWIVKPDPHPIEMRPGLLASLTLLGLIFGGVALRRLLRIHDTCDGGMNPVLSSVSGDVWAVRVWYFLLHSVFLSMAGKSRLRLNACICVGSFAQTASCKVVNATTLSSLDTRIAGSGRSGNSP